MNSVRCVALTLRRLKIQVGVVFAVAILSAACSTAPVEYKLQQDASVAPTNLAILVNSPVGAYVDAVDGQPPPDRTWNKPFYGNKFNGKFRMELAPGEHTLAVRYGPTSPPFYSWGSDTTMRDADGNVYTTKEHRMEVRFLAEPGKTYTALMTWDPDQGWRAWVETRHPLPRPK